MYVNNKNKIIIAMYKNSNHKYTSNNANNIFIIIPQGEKCLEQHLLCCRSGLRVFC